jgi:hypothetical protein
MTSSKTVMAPNIAGAIASRNNVILNRRETQEITASISFTSSSSGDDGDLAASMVPHFPTGHSHGCDFQDTNPSCFDEPSNKDETVKSPEKVISSAMSFRIYIV